MLWSARVTTLTGTAMLTLASRTVYKEMTVRNLNTTNTLLKLMHRMEQAGSG